jgi:hypothetical protein
LKITGQVYARKTQQTTVIPELSKLVESKEVDEIAMFPSSKLTVDQQQKSQVQGLTSYDNPIGLKVGKRTPIAQFQNIQANSNSIASMSEETSHRARFNSLFRTEIVKNDAGTVIQATTEKSDVGTVPKLLLKRKAAWSGIVGIRRSDPANSNRAVDDQSDVAAEVGAHMPQPEVPFSDSVRLRFQRQRCVLS